MFTLGLLFLSLFCGRPAAFLLDDGDPNNVDFSSLGLMEDLNFTPVATSENILFEADKIRIRDCDNEVLGWCSSATDTDPSVHIVFPEAMVIKSLTLESTSVSCSRVQAADDMEMFELQYLDQESELKTYETNIPGPKLGDGGRNIYDLYPTVYTQMLKIIPSRPGACFALKVAGSNGTEMCSKISCKNGGLCSGVEQCSCPAGFMGQMCETKVTAENIATNSYEFLKMKDRVIFTPDANFTSIGDVTLGNAITRRFFFPFVHGLGCHFHGVTSAIHHVFGHHHYSHSSIFHTLNPWNGFTHSLHVSFGHHHYHDGHSCLFNYHPNPWHGFGVHCYYHKGQIHYGVSYGHRHFNLKVNFSPSANKNYNVVLSFGLLHGLSVHINGQLSGSQTKPTTTPPTQPPPKYPGICIGICGGPQPHPIQMTVSHVVSAALNHAGLALIGLAHLLSPSVPTVQPQPQTKPPPPSTVTTSTSTTSTVTPATKAVTTVPFGATTPAKVFTPYPSTTKLIATATRPHSTTTHSTTTAMGNGTLCYTCSQQATDGSCRSVSRCQSNEVCSLYKDANGYTHKCLDQKVCTQAQALVPSVCWICCTGSLCNDRCSTTSTKPPCYDKITCRALQLTGFNVCSSPRLAAAHCPKSCHIC